jgi:hypothetical protein
LRPRADRRGADPRGHSSAGRAPALQAGGHRFESGCLQKQPTRKQPAETGHQLPESMLSPDDGSWVDGTVTRGKVTRSWRYRSSERTIPSALVAEPTVVGWAMNLFFVRVNQVLVRLWARAIGLPVGCGVVGFPTTDRGRPTSGPVVRLMSDRESVSGVSKPRFGFSRPGARP